MKYLRLVEGLKKVGLTRLAVMGIAALSLSSCLKNKGPEYVEYDVAALSVYHVSPGTGDFDFVLDGVKVWGPFPYGVFSDSRYFQVYTGQRHAAFYKTGSYTDTIRTAKINMEKNAIYSLFLIGKDDAPETMLVKDEWNAPAQGTANVRFINLSPDIGELSLKVNTESGAESGDSTLFAGVDYKQVSDFSDVPAKTYTFKIFEGDDEKDFIPNISIGSGKTYTVIAQGLAEAGVSGSLKVLVKVNEHRQ